MRTTFQVATALKELKDTDQAKKVKPRYLRHPSKISKKRQQQLILPGNDLEKTMIISKKKKIQDKLNAFFKKMKTKSVFISQVIVHRIFFVVVMAVISSVLIRL